MIRQFAVSGIKRLGLTRPLFRLRESAARLDFRVRLRNHRFRMAGAPDSLPIPPERLITLVAGTPDIGWFLEYGETAAGAIRSVLARNSLDIDTFGSILDFGCGCGRIIRHWRGLNRMRITGTDYNPELLDWCRANLGFASFHANNRNPPLPFDDETFDFVYALSVFTHLEESMQRPWIDELRRVLRPDGCLLITTQGDSYEHLLLKSERDALHSGHLVVRHQEMAGTNLCAVFHPAGYLQSEMLSGFEIVEFARVSAGETCGLLQDITLARKPVG